MAGDVCLGKETFIEHLLCARPRIGPIEGGGWIGPVPGFLPSANPSDSLPGVGVDDVNPTLCSAWDTFI